LRNQSQSRRAFVWKQIPWAKVQRKVVKLQKRIFQAAKSGQDAKARRLQRLLVKSYYARLLAVRRVTQDNQGKKTAGVDGMRVISPRQRIKLAESIAQDRTFRTYNGKDIYRRPKMPAPYSYDLRQKVINAIELEVLHNRK